MTILLRRLVLPVCLIGLLGGLEARASSALEVGRLFPSIAFPQLDGGGLISLEAYRGRKLVLHVWASW